MGGVEGDGEGYSKRVDPLLPPTLLREACCIWDVGLGSSAVSWPMDSTYLHLDSLQGYAVD
jgi:hypothetical protein